MIEDKSLGLISVFIRNLTVTDSGTYRCRAGSQPVQEVNFNVKQEPCCGRSEDQTAYLGGTAVIHCKYPEEYKDHGKQLFKVQNGSLECIITAFGSPFTNGRFSLNVNEQEHVFSVTIADVERSDAGVYFCGIHTNIYTPLLTEIQLHVSENQEQTDASGQSDLYIISTVCSCVILLLAVGLSLSLFKCRCKKTEGSVSSDQRDTRDGDEEVNSPYYEAIQDSAQVSIGLNTVYATPFTHKPL
ncbi:polymeric immunoglobulin receptor [Rhinichthys klamathensis goyatoka]|uniref:polymeric immunoglobulin receptor n=1 Tax=Rhinichthys klamathensis goyatoka TaxID=3034132 RepID=UPI0024B4A010|nr:polymeric immunoglobulin receptor [Rhinichthys klamathensis goyatoka]